MSKELVNITRGRDSVSADSKCPKFSIVTICLNEVEKIEDTVLSVLNQSYEGFEYIVVDGGSTDGTLNILLKHKHRFKVLVSEKDRGRFHAMNKGLSYCDGRYVLFMNGGDTIHRSELLAELADQELEADIIYGDLLFNRMDGEAPIRISSPSKIDSYYLLLRTVPHPASIVARDLFRRVGGFNEAYTICGDYDFFVRAILMHKASTHYIPRVFCVFDGTGVSNADPDTLLTERLKVQRYHMSAIAYGVSKVRTYIVRNPNSRVARCALGLGARVHRGMRYRIVRRRSSGVKVK